MTRISMMTILVIVSAIISAVPVVEGRAVNGNDLALSYVEARSENERRELVDGAGRRPHLFRYLQIMELEEVEVGRRTGVRITALEPASGLDITFTVNQPVSLRILREEPESVRGRAIAVSGVIADVDRQTGTFYLDPVIVRHKDRLTPVLGRREMLYEQNDELIFYSFSGGRELVQLQYRDRDLLRHRGRILDVQGEQAWADFLQQELAKRKQQRAHEATP